MKKDSKNSGTWYCASLLFKANYSDDNMNSCPLWEECMVAIFAESDTDATQQANELGKSKEHSYSSNGVNIVWKFVQIERIYQIENQEIEHGTELFSRFLRDSEARSILTPFEDEAS